MNTCFPVNTTTPVHITAYDMCGNGITKVTRLRQQRVILTLCNYRTCDAEARRYLATKARLAAIVHQDDKSRL